MTDTTVETAAKKAVAKPRKATAAKPSTPKPEPKPATVELTAEELAENLRVRRGRLEIAYYKADGENDGPRADATWRALVRVSQELNTIKLHSSLN